MIISDIVGLGLTILFIIWLSGLIEKSKKGK